MTIIPSETAGKFQVMKIFIHIFQISIFTDKKVGLITGFSSDIMTAADQLLRILTRPEINHSKCANLKEKILLVTY